jgi:hypothetical protein
MLHDRHQYLGRSMTGYGMWLSEMRRQFFAVCPQAFLTIDGVPNMYVLTDVDAWERFLDSGGSKLRYAYEINPGDLLRSSEHNSWQPVLRVEAAEYPVHQWTIAVPGDRFLASKTDVFEVLTTTTNGAHHDNARFDSDATDREGSNRRTSRDGE